MKYKLTDRQISTALGKEVVVLDHKDGVYYSLEDVGQTVWAALQANPQTIDELVETVCNEYEIDPTTARQDIEALLNDLLKEKLVEATPLP